MNISKNELNALLFLQENGGVLVSSLEEKNEKDRFGDMIFGMAIFKKLIKKELCFITEEDPVMLNNGEMFDFTPSLEITELGEDLLKKSLH